jgi:hypothetical protein
MPVTRTTSDRSSGPVGPVLEPALQAVTRERRRQTRTRHRPPGCGAYTCRTISERASTHRVPPRSVRH